MLLEMVPFTHKTVHVNRCGELKHFKCYSLICMTYDNVKSRFTCKEATCAEWKYEYTRMNTKGENKLDDSHEYSEINEDYSRRNEYTAHAKKRLHKI